MHTIVIAVMRMLPLKQATFCDTLFIEAHCIFRKRPVDMHVRAKLHLCTGVGSSTDPQPAWTSWSHHFRDWQRPN
jgi:hypothetical protein